MAFNENKPLVNSPLNSAEIRNNFQHLKEVVSKEHTWDDKDPANAQHKLDEIKGVFSGATQRDTVNGYDYVTGSNKGGTQGLETYYHHVIKANLENGEHSLKSILQELITKAHSHQVQRHLYNCNCNCNCGGNN